MISGHTGWVRCVAVEPGNKWFCTGSADRTIKVRRSDDIITVLSSEQKCADYVPGESKRKIWGLCQASLIEPTCQARFFEVYCIEERLT